MNPIVAPTTREEAAALARRSSHWTAGTVNLDTREESQKPTPFRADDRAALVAMIERCGWVRQPDDGFGENWKHPGGPNNPNAPWSFARACQFTLHALADKRESTLFFAGLPIAPLPSAAELVRP